MYGGKRLRTKTFRRRIHAGESIDMPRDQEPVQVPPPRTILTPKPCPGLLLSGPLLPERHFHDAPDDGLVDVLVVVLLLRRGGLLLLLALLVPEGPWPPLLSAHLPQSALHGDTVLPLRGIEGLARNNQCWSYSWISLSGGPEDDCGGAGGLGAGRPVLHDADFLLFAPPFVVFFPFDFDLPLVSRLFASQKNTAARAGQRRSSDKRKRVAPNSKDN